MHLGFLRKKSGYNARLVGGIAQLVRAQHS